MTIVTGARLTPGGLHLGHYVGCFSSRECISDDAVFVIGDREVEGQPHDAVRNALVDLLADVRAISATTRIVRQSRLHIEYEELLHRVEALVTLRQLQAAHPAKRRIRAGDFEGTVKAFIFPLDSVCTYLVLDATVVMMNDDNLRIVALAQRVAKRLNGTPSRSIVTVPHLVHGKEPRIVGHNYRKMAKGNGNAIFFTETDDALARKIEALLSLKYLFRIDPASRASYLAAPGSFILPPMYAPLVLLRALGHTFDDETRQRVQRPSGRPELRSLLTSAIRNIVLPIRIRSTELRQTPEKLLASLESDTEYVCLGVRRRASAICAAVDENRSAVA